MAELKVHKVIGSLPGTLDASAIYLVKNGSLIDFYATNDAGTVVAYALNTGGSTGDMSTIKLRSGALQNADATTNIAIQWDTEDFKDATTFTHSTVTNNSRITVANTGKYLVTGVIDYTGTTSNYRFTARASIRINGTTILPDYFDASYIRFSGGSNNSGVQFGIVLNLTANDYFEILSKKINTISGNATTTAGTNMSVVRLTGTKGDTGAPGATGLPGGTLPTYSTTSTSTLTPESDTYGQFIITAQAVALTIANHVTSVPSDFAQMIIRIKDNGTARTISFGTEYRSMGNTLPTTTVASKTTYLGFKWNSADSKWDLIALAQEA